MLYILFIDRINKLTVWRHRGRHAYDSYKIRFGTKYTHSPYVYYITENKFNELKQYHDKILSDVEILRIRQAIY